MKAFKEYSIDEGITQGMLASFSSCRQQCRFMLSGWEKRGAEKVSLIFGALFHSILEQHYKTVAAHQQPQTLEAKVKVWMQAEGKRFANQQAVADALGFLTALWNPYLEFWTRDDSVKNWVAVEGEFRVEYQGFLERGKRDGVYENKRSLLWLLESKTKSRIDEEVLSDTLIFDFQNLYYVTSLEYELARPVGGVLYNVIRTPQLKQGKTESKSAFVQRIKEDIEKQPEHYFKRYELIYPKELKERFKQELRVKLRLFKEWVESDFALTYKNENACSGKWTCEFLQACSQNGLAGYSRTRELFVECGGRAK
jgi:hypothetical protein